MKLPLFIDAAIVLLLLFFLKRKKIFLLENIFIMMILEFLVTSYCAILYINLDVWSVADKTDLFIIFRIYEVILIPFIWLWYFNLLPGRGSWTAKSILTIVFVGIQYGVEQWLRNWDVITYHNWHGWQSFLVHLFVLSITMISLIWYRRHLQKEGSDSR